MRLILLAWMAGTVLVLALLAYDPVYQQGVAVTDDDPVEWESSESEPLLCMDTWEGVC